MIKIEFPAERTDIATAIGKALLEIGGVAVNSEVTHTVGDMSVTEKVTTTTAIEKEPSQKGHEDYLSEQEAGASEDMAPLEDITPEQTRWKASDTADPRVDHEGVGFNEAFCGKAQKPFYSSGKQQGQWKKRQGVDQVDYDKWYAGELANVDTGSNEGETTGQVDTAGAFGNQDTATDTGAPADLGAFMLWVTGKQTAGILTQHDVTAAYTHSGLDVSDLMPPTPTDRMLLNLSTVYEILKQKAGA